MGFKLIKDGIYKMNIPYQDGYTSVLALENGGKWMLVDFAAKDKDGKGYIIPAINELGFAPDVLLCTHIHEDHSGGIKILADAFPKAEIAAFSHEFKAHKIHYLTDGEAFFGRYKVLHLPGHTDDSVGILDMKNNILLSSDCLLGRGIAIYGPGLDNPGVYLDTLKRVSELGLSGIVAAHDYEPFGGEIFGDKVNEYINICAEVARAILAVALENPDADPKTITEIYNSDKSRLPIGEWTAEGAVKYLKGREGAL